MKRRGLIPGLFVMGFAAYCPPFAFGEQARETVMVANVTSGGENAASFASTLTALLVPWLRKNSGSIVSTAEDLDAGAEQGGCKGWLPCYLDWMCKLGISRLLAIDVVFHEERLEVKLSSQKCAEREAIEASVSAPASAIPLDVFAKVASKAQQLLAGKQAESEAVAPAGPPGAAAAAAQDESRKPVSVLRSPTVIERRGTFWPWVFGGSSIVFALSGAALHVLAYDSAQQVRGSVHSRMEAEDLIGTGQGRLTTAFILYGSAALMAGAAVSMHFVVSKEVREVIPEKDDYFFSIEGQGIEVKF